jgi:hypothetical protein
LKNGCFALQVFVHFNDIRAGCEGLHSGGTGATYLRIMTFHTESTQIGAKCRIFTFFQRDQIALKNSGNQRLSTALANGLACL